MNDFEEIKNLIKAHFPSFDYNTWLADMKVEHYREKILTINTASYFKKLKIEEKYLDEIFKVVVNTLPDLERIEVNFGKSDSSTPKEVFSGENGSKSKDNSFKKPIHKEQELSLPKDRKKDDRKKDNLVLEENTFDNFLVYPENQLAFDFSEKVIEKIGYINPLYIFGKVGVGKTHLSQAIYHQIRKMFSFYRMKYINPNDFVSEYRNALKFKQDRNFRINYRSLDILFIDDIQFFMGKEKSSQEFFDIFNAIFRPNKQMIFCSDREPSELDQIDDRLKSRLSAAVILELKSPEKDSRKKILKHFNQKLKTGLNDEVIDFLAENLEGDVRKIKGAIKSISFFQEVSPRPITIQFCEQNFNHLFKNRKRISSRELLEKVSKINQISIKELTTPNNTPNLKKIRNITIYLLRKNTDLSLKSIGELMGGITAASVLYTTNSISKKRKLDSTIDNIIEKTFS